MAPRKSLAIRRTMKHHTMAMGNVRQSRGTGGMQQEGVIADAAVVPRTAMVPTRMRHVEAACAIVLWLAFFPAMFYIGNDALNCVFLVLVTGLMLHAYAMRPYCVEFDEEEEEAMMEMAGNADPKLVSNSNAFDFSNRDGQEECKLVGFVMLLLCTVGSSIALSMGGADVLHSWLTPMATDCSVADLGKLQSNYARFHCTDGFVDLSQQRSLLSKGGTLVKTYTEYRIAPVYLEQTSKRKSLIAWAVSKNIKLTENPCGEIGLCGIFASKADRLSDEASFKALKAVARDEMIKAGTSDKFDQDRIPTVILTNLMNPEGKALYFYVGSFFYLLVLLGLCRTQWSMFFEPPSRLDGDLFFAGNDRYSRLEDSNDRRTSETELE